MNFSMFPKFWQITINLLTNLFLSETLLDINIRHCDFHKKESRKDFSGQYSMKMVKMKFVFKILNISNTPYHIPNISALISSIFPKHWIKNATSSCIKLTLLCTALRSCRRNDINSILSASHLSLLPGLLLYLK
jgi:hypothetical protein